MSSLNVRIQLSQDPDAHQACESLIMRVKRYSPDFMRVKRYSPDFIEGV